jgi:hypothetical protein
MGLNERQGEETGSEVYTDHLPAGSDCRVQREIRPTQRAPTMAVSETRDTPVVWVDTWICPTVQKLYNIACFTVVDIAVTAP